jgi:hypothetical protein
MNEVLTPEEEKGFEMLLKPIMDVLIYEYKKNEFILFNIYTLKVNKDKSVVVSNIYNDNIYTFVNTKNATAWIILDYRNKIVPANRIMELDRKVASITVDRVIHSKMKKSRNLETREIHRDKLGYDLYKLSQFQNELDKYIILANNCQQQGFENELKRIHRK